MNNEKLIRSLFKDPLESITEIAGDASSRKYFRLTTSSKSYVACLDRPFSKDNYPFIEVQQFLSQLNIPVPRLYHVEPSHGYLLQQDLGDTTLLHYSSQFDPKKELNTYKKCIDVLVRFQSCHLAPAAHSFQKKAFDEQTLNREVDFSIEHLSNFLLKDHSRWQQEIHSIRDDFAQINKIIAQKSMVFTHRDFHSRNLMATKDGIVVIDFQDARMGLPQYDLVSLLDDCYYELDESNKENLKKYYFGQLCQIVEDQKSYSDFSHLYDLMCLQRTFKAMGTFAFLSRSCYTKHIAFAFEKLKKVARKHNDSLRKNLSLIYYEH